MTLRTKAEYIKMDIVYKYDGVPGSGPGVYKWGTRKIKTKQIKSLFYKIDSFFKKSLKIYYTVPDLLIKIS